ncbi:MAG TPA: histidine kinase [Gammaproteobacteria bacterium]
MTQLITRLPPLRTLDRDLLVAGITVLLWALDTTFDLTYWLAVSPLSGAERWHAVTRPLLLEHLLLLPALVACYLAAMRASRLLSQPVLVFLAHASLALAFVTLARLLALTGYYLAASAADLGNPHYHGLLTAVTHPFNSLDDVLINLTFYLLGLFILAGVNTRMDLENERNRTSELYALWLNARLDTLRGQLNPHFLFNSLHTISSLLFTDIRRADKLLADFSDVLRTTLREGQREFSTVREEVDYARRYLSIEETRFEDRLVTRFAVQEAALGARVPSLILQPLIENAIKYGISASAGANTVAVEASRSGETLVLEVSNDFRPENAVSAERKTGIGLNNVRERLMAIYGADYTLSSIHIPGNRWSTRISLPYQEALRQ